MTRTSTAVAAPKAFCISSKDINAFGSLLSAVSYRFDEVIKTEMAQVMPETLTSDRALFQNRISSHDTFGSRYHRSRVNEIDLK